MKKIFLAVLLALCAMSAKAQNVTGTLVASAAACPSTPGAFSTSTSAVTLAISGPTGSVSFQVTGSAGTTSFFASSSGAGGTVVWSPLTVTSSAGGAAATTVTTSGTYNNSNVGGFTFFCALVTSYTGGSEIVSIQASLAGSGGATFTGCFSGGAGIISCPGGFNVETAGALLYQVTNNASIGTGANLAVCDDGTGLAETCQAATSTTNQVLGFCVSGCGKSGLALIGLIGWNSVIFDSQTVARDYAISSSTVNGELHDAGAALTAGQPNFFIFTANTGTGTVGQVRLLIADDFTTSGTITITEICHGTIVLPTSAVGSAGKYGASSSAPLQTACSGMLTTDRITLTFNADVTGVTGYAPSATGGVEVLAYPDSGGGKIDLYLINDTGAPITPGVATVNYQVTR